MVNLGSQRVSISRILSRLFILIWKLIKVAIRIAAILLLLLLLITSIWLLRKVETDAGPVPRWKVGQVWARNFLEMPSPCRAGYGMGLITTLIVAIGEPVSAVMKDEIGWTDVPARA